MYFYLEGAQNAYDFHKIRLLPQYSCEKYEIFTCNKQDQIYNRQNKLIKLICIHSLNLIPFDYSILCKMHYKYQKYRFNIIRKNIQYCFDVKIKISKMLIRALNCHTLY